MKMADELQNPMPKFVVDDLFSPEDLHLTPEDISRINMLKSEAECSKLKRKLDKSLSRIAFLEKRILDLTESKIRVDTRNTAAQSLLEGYLKNSSLNDQTRERFDSLLRVLGPPSDTTVNDATLPPQSVELEILSTVQDHLQDNTFSVSTIEKHNDRKRLSSMQDNASINKQPRNSENRNIIKRKKSGPTNSPKTCSVKSENIDPPRSPLTCQLKENNNYGQVIPSCQSEDGNYYQPETPADNKQYEDLVSNKTSTVPYFSEPKTSPEKDHQVPKSIIQSRQLIIPEATRNHPPGEMGETATLFSKQSAVELFTKSLTQTPNSDSWSKAVENLCGRLKYDQLGLKLAAAYINDSLQTNPDLEYIFNKYLTALENENIGPQDSEIDENGTIILKLFYITCDKIQEDADAKKEAVWILYHTSFFSHDISKQFFENLFKSAYKLKRGNMSLDDIFLFLKRLSIVDFSSEDVFSVHPRLQQYLRTHQKQTWKFKVSMLSILNSIKVLLQSDEIPSDQIIHAQTIWKHTQIDTELLCKYERLPGWICSKLTNFGKHQENYDFSCEALVILESAGREQKRSTLNVKFWKGSALEDLGRYSESLQLLTELYEEQKEILGENDDDSLKTAKYIGILYCRLKNFEEAMKWYLTTIERKEKLSGKGHPEILDLKNNIAYALTGLEKYKDAAEIYSELLKVHEKALGPNDKHTLTTKHNLAVVRFHEQKFEDALRMLQEVLEVEKTVLEVDDPEILATKFWIVKTYQSLGRINEALELVNEVWQKRKEILEPQYRLTISSKNLILIHEADND